MRILRRIAVTTAAIVTAAALTACGTPASDTAPAAADAPTVVVNTLNGTGCPSNTAVAADVSGAGFRIDYPAAMTAKAGPGVAAAAQRVACQANVTATWAGHTYTVSGEHHGSLQVPAGSSATQRTTYYLTSAGLPVDHVTAGPASGPYAASDPNALAVPCGTTTNLNVKVELRVTPGAAASFTLDGPDPAGSVIGLAWSAC